MYRTKPGSWRPARLRSVDYGILIWTLFLAAVIRGLDYATGGDVWSARDFMVSVAPAEVWGVFGFLVGAAFLALGVLARIHVLVYIGHWWLATTYGLNALVLFLASTPDAPFFDGIRGTGATATVAMLHFLLLLRTGPRPLQEQEPDQVRTTPEELIISQREVGA